MNFSSIIGHGNIMKLLERGVQNRTLYPSLIFYGMEGVGKKLTALTMAKGLNCPSREEKPCGLCSICKSIDHHNFPDVQLILPSYYDDRLNKRERTSFNIKIDQIRELIQNINLKPYHAEKKIYIIDYAEMLTEEASNALLKTLEEPPSYAMIILITSAYYSLLPTIRSRCWGWPFHPIPAREIETFLRQAKGLSPKVAKKLALISEGSMRKALEVDPRNHAAQSEKLLTMVEKSLAGDATYLIKSAEEISKNLEELRHHLDLLLSLHRDMLMIQKRGEGVDLIHEELAERLKSLSERLGYKVLTMIEKIHETKDLLKLNVHRKVAIEALFFNFFNIPS